MKNNFAKMAIKSSRLSTRLDNSYLLEFRGISDSFAVAQAPDSQRRSQGWMYSTSHSQCSLIALVLILYALIHSIPSMSQAGTLDLGFNSGDIGFGRGDLTSGPINCLVQQPDGKILVAGNFSGYNNVRSNGIVRINPDGTLDPTFNADAGATMVRAMCLQPDGKIIIGGWFTSYNGVNRKHIARLNTDGSLDMNFDPGTGANGNIETIALQPDGKILMGGDFTTYRSNQRNRIARANADGTLDTTYDPGIGPNGTVRTLSLLPNGRFYVGGNFGTYNGVTAGGIFRSNADGTMDPTFNTGSPGWVYSIAVQPDAKLVVGGLEAVKRLHADGTLDAGFATATIEGGFIFSLAHLPDGKVLIGGMINTIGGIARKNIARLNQDGSLDVGFDPGTGASWQVNTILPLVGGQTLMGGNFTTFNGKGYQHLVRLNAEGSVDVSFEPGNGANGPVTSAIILEDGSIILTGMFHGFNGLAREGHVRLAPDGTLSPTEDEGYGWTGKLLLLPNGKYLCAGAGGRLARFNADGTLDLTFDTGAGFAGGLSTRINALALQPDGRILVGGDFDTYNGIPKHNICRIEPDGALDPSFDPGVGPEGPVVTVAVMLDGRILLGGNLISFNGYLVERIACLNADGSFDPNFLSSTGANSTVYDIVVQQDGKVLVAGWFYLYQDESIGGIVRLNTDGTIDPTFNPGGEGVLQYGVETILQQPDGKLLIGGSFNSYNGVPRSRIARLNSDGSLDPGFDPGTGLNAGTVTIFPRVSVMALMPNGDLIIAGDFDRYNGIGRNRVARLNAGVVGIAEHSAGSLGLYPNPSAGNVLFAIDGAADITVLDAAGRTVVAQTHTSAGPVVLDLSHEPSGIYVVRVVSMDTISMERFILQR
jgi:uncharacterized delta-60 repeat protein